MNSCIHSGSNDYSGGDTVWYNYATASAGSIVNKSASDTAGNMNIAVESICPKNWTLPSKKQVDSNRATSNFLPVKGGRYLNGGFDYGDAGGFWWGSEASTNVLRYYMNYGSRLATEVNVRYVGYYIRCVSEEKTVLDLTYMQDMTLSISSLSPTS